MTRLDADSPSEAIRPEATQMAQRLLDLALDGRPSKEGALNELEHQALRHVLAQFLSPGRAPHRHEMAIALGLTSDELDDILKRLHASDRIYLDPRTQEVLVAYPFSTGGTSHLVAFQDGGETRAVFAPCAIDALGIPFLLQRDSSIASPCGWCGKGIALDVHEGAIARVEPRWAVVWVGTCRTRHAATSVCPTMNFFCGPAHADAWSKGHAEQAGQRLTLGEALYLGQKLFEGLLEQSNASSG